MPRKFEEEAYARKCEEKRARKTRQRTELWVRRSTYNPREPSEVWVRMAELRAIRDHNAAVARGEPQSWFTNPFGNHSGLCPICQQKKLM